MADVERADLDPDGGDREEEEWIVCQVWDVVVGVGYYSWWSPLPLVPGVDYLRLWRADRRAVVVGVDPMRW